MAREGMDLRGLYRLSTGGRTWRGGTRCRRLYRWWGNWADQGGESAANRTEAGSGGAWREEQGWREVQQDREAEEAPLGAAGGAVQGT